MPCRIDLPPPPPPPSHLRKIPALALAAIVAVAALALFATDTVHADDDYYSWDSTNQEWTFGFSQDAQTTYSFSKWAPDMWTVLPNASFGTLPYNYTITPALPSGLTLRGHPDAGGVTLVRSKGYDISASAAADYILRACDSSSPSQCADLTINIAITDSLGWVYGWGSDTLTMADKTFQPGTIETKQTSLPMAAVGSGSVTYTISPALDNGITMKTWTKHSSQAGPVATLTSSTATVAAAKKTYTLTATSGAASITTPITLP